MRMTSRLVKLTGRRVTVLVLCVLAGSLAAMTQSAGAVSIGDPSAQSGEKSSSAVGKSPLPPDWTTYHGANSRTGVAVGVPAVHRLVPAWRRQLDGAVYGQPLVIGAVVVVATENDSVYGLADAIFHVGAAGLRLTPALAARLDQADELAILATLGRFPALVAEAAALREPHRIVFYAQELSQAFQSYFTRRKDDPVLPQEKHTREPGWEARWDWDTTRARLLWIEAIRAVYGASLRLLGITALSRMVRLGLADTAASRDGATKATEDDEEAGS